MHDLFVLIGLKNIPDLHKLFVKRERETQRGVFLMTIDIDTDSKYARLKKVEKSGLEAFEIRSESNEEVIKNNAIAQSIKQYETAWQYCVMFEINQVIVGGCFVPFDQPVELESAIEQAIATYNNS